jgi:hypothetical protein
MKTTKAFITLGLALASVIMLPVAHADDYDQASKLTFNQSIQIPGRVLPAGTYWFVLADINYRNVVKVYNSDRSTLYATIPTTVAQRVKITDDTAITFASLGDAQPEAIVTWFYAGRDFGHQFVYSKVQAQELAQAKHHTVEVATAKVSREASGG